jgi:regulator of sigma D
MLICKINRGQHMVKSKNGSGPQMILDITDEEKKIAGAVKTEFKEVLRKIDDAIHVVTDLRDAIVNERPSKEDLKSKYAGRLIRYRRKIKASFNDALSLVKVSLEKLSKISDPEMVRLREILIAEIDELSSGAEAILDLLDESERESFTKTIEKISAQMEKRQKSITDVIDNQLFNHIDHDILGRMKISTDTLRFRIRRRARIIKQLARYK